MVSEAQADLPKKAKKAEKFKISACAVCLQFTTSLKVESQIKLFRLFVKVNFRRG
jgi:hypothetical protein